MTVPLAYAAYKWLFPDPEPATRIVLVPPDFRRRRVQDSLVLPPTDLIRLQHDIAHNDLINDVYPRSASFFMCPQSLTPAQVAGQSATPTPGPRGPAGAPFSSSTAPYPSHASYSNDGESSSFLSVEGHVFTERVPNPAYSGPLPHAQGHAEGRARGQKLPALGTAAPLPWVHRPGAEAHLYWVPGADAAAHAEQQKQQQMWLQRRVQWQQQQWQQQQQQQQGGDNGYVAATGLMPMDPPPTTYTNLEGTPLSSFVQASFTSRHGGSLCLRGALNGGTVASASGHPGSSSPFSVFFVAPVVVGGTSVGTAPSSPRSAASAASAAAAQSGAGLDIFDRISNTTSLTAAAAAANAASASSHGGAAHGAAGPTAVARAVSQPFAGAGCRARSDVARVGVRYDGQSALAGLCWSQPRGPGSAALPASSPSSVAPAGAGSNTGAGVPEGVLEGWAGVRGPRLTAVLHGGLAWPTGETDLSGAAVYEAGPLLAPRRPDGAGAGSGAVGQGGGRSFQLGYEWRRWGAEHVFSFLHRLIMRRGVVNPMEKSEVVGIHNYVDVGLQIAFGDSNGGAKRGPRVTLPPSLSPSSSYSPGVYSPTIPSEEHRAEASPLSALSLVGAWQINKNALVKTRVRDSDVAAVLALKSWAVPSSTAALGVIYGFGTNRAEVGVRIEMENFGQVLHHRMGAQEVAAVESRFVKADEFPAEGHRDDLRM